MKTFLISTMLAAGMAGPARAAGSAEAGRCRDWPLWQRYVEHFIAQDGRVIDRVAQDRSTSEGQSYALFFSLVADDRALFDKILFWTQQNLAGGDLAQHLPSWNWGHQRDGNWGVLDANSASDADLWMAYALLEAGRIWSEPRYDRLARALLENVAQHETANLRELGPMLLPGASGFVIEAGRGVRLNPSYQPPQLLARFVSAEVPGPWSAILASSLRMLRETAPEGAVADWVVYRPKHGFAADTIHGRIGSYDAIRAYLWAGMLPDPALARKLGGLVPDASALPEQIDVLSLRHKGKAPVGFYGALLPLARARGDAQAARQLEEKIAASQKNGLYGDPPAYYDQNLLLFALGFSEGRYRFDPRGKLERQCER